jgi:hypothetical protein
MGRLPATSVLLTIFILIQAWVIAMHVVLPLNRELKTLEGRSALERSALLSFGDRFTGYLRFVIDEIPDDARVVLPPISVDETYGNIGIMQYFLFPRDIVNCPSVADTSGCLEQFRGGATYFLFVKGFPGKVMVAETRQFVEFDVDLGIFLPVQ